MTVTEIALVVSDVGNGLREGLDQENNARLLD
jgi:hypothetical protein